MIRVYILTGYALGMSGLVAYARRPDRLTRLRRSGRRDTETEDI